MEKIIDKLNDLIALDIDAVNAYQAAINRLSTQFLKDQLTEFQADHERHVRDLTEYVTRFGGKARQKADLKGVFLKGFTAITSAMGDEAALKAMQANEQLTNRTYQNAINDQSWPDDVRVTIQKNLEDEQRHLSFIVEALRNRVWEAGQSPQP